MPSNETETQRNSNASKDIKTGNTNVKIQSLNNNQQQQEVIDSEEAVAMARKAKQHKIWNRRLKIFFCCLGYKKNKDSIADVAGIFAEFYADLNVPSSEVAAGFVLLSKYQAAQRQYIVDNHLLGIDQYLSSLPITSSTNFLDISTAEDSHLINDLIYYMNYSLAIFGWPMQVVDDPCMLCCIFPYLKLCCCCKRKQRKRKDSSIKNKKKEKKKTDDKNENSNTKDCKSSSCPYEEKCQQKSNQVSNQEDKTITRSEQSNENKNHGVLADDCDGPMVLGDNCCSCNIASVERRLAAHNYEIIYVTYKVDVNIVPFLVIADHSKQAIVVAMRGSMGLSDMVTDMNAQADKIPIDDCPDDWLSHRGITRASNNVLKTLREEHILDRAFNCRPDLNSQEYNLVLCGHSLGAGVAAILGILMRKQYPSLKAYLYSPPGGILSLPVVEYTKEFATGIILGNDCVPRLGIAQLERLRYHVLLSLKSSEQSTNRILTKAMCPSCCFGENNVEYDPNESLNLLHGLEGRSFDYKGNKIPFQVQPQLLYVPGRLIHIVKNYNFKTTRRFFNEPIYQAIWNENTAYDRILISEGMLFDHLPNHLMHAMKMLFSNTLPGRKESKSSTFENDTFIQGPTAQYKRNSSDGNNNDPDGYIDQNSNKETVIENGNDNKNSIIDATRSDENNNNSISNKLESSAGDIKTVDSAAGLKELKDVIKVSLDNNGNDDSFENKNNESDHQTT